MYRRQQMEHEVFDVVLLEKVTEDQDEQGEGCRLSLGM